VDCDYFTDAIDYAQVKVLDRFESAPMTLAAAEHGEVRVNRQVVGFKKVKFYTLENVGAGHLSMPEQEMHTTSFWLHFPEAFLSGFPDLSPTERQNGLTGLGNALRAVAALLVMCDPRDLGVALTENIASGLKSFEPNLYLYDNYPGGVGLSAPLFQLARELVARTRDLIGSCACEAGCPGCVGPVGEIGARGKEAALRILINLSSESPAT
jgi:DEAD/DEAH box helicase domain-containing protein